jgi:hypothetical protein
MRNGRRFFWIGVAAALLAGVPSPGAAQEEAQAQVPLVPLVQLQGHEFICKSVGIFSFGGHYCRGGVAQERSVSIFRSGRVVSVFTGTQETATLVGDAPQYDFRSLVPLIKEPKASARSVANLIAYLNSQWITNWTGPCNPIPVPTTDLTGELSDFRYTIIWFPADGNRHYTVLDNKAARVCPPQVNAIFNAIVAFGSTGTRSAATDEP